MRAEAAYHLASLATVAGKADEVRKLVALISQIDATSSWAQRATLLLANLPAGQAPGEAPAAGLNFKPGN